VSIEHQIEGTLTKAATAATVEKSTKIECLKKEWVEMSIFKIKKMQPKIEKLAPP